jgi:hypothetical protein
VQIQERKLANHDAGAALASTAKVVSDSLDTTERVLVLSRPLTGSSLDYYTFSASASTLPIIIAVGSKPTFTSTAVHRLQSSAVISLAAAGAPTCICRDPKSNAGTIGGHKVSGFAVVCPLIQI